MRDTEDRCNLSGLLPTECACRVHSRPAPLYPNTEIATRFPARFNSYCDGCGNKMLEGSPIARSIDGDYLCKSCSE